MSRALADRLAAAPLAFDVAVFLVLVIPTGIALGLAIDADTSSARLLAGLLTDVGVALIAAWLATFPTST